MKKYVLKTYLNTLLGKEKAAMLSNALKAHRPIVVMGAHCSGKTTLVRVLRALGYSAEEDLESRCQKPWPDNSYFVVMERPLKRMAPNAAALIFESLGIWERG